MDNEWHVGTGTMYDYGFRIYDPRIAKFLSVDPLTKSYPMLTPYQFASNTPIWAIDLDGLEAFVLWGGSREKNPDGTPRYSGISDNRTFDWAAKKLNKKSYNNSATLIELKSGKQVVNEINSQADNFIENLDIIAHMTPLSVQVSNEENVNVGLYASWTGKKLIEQYYRNFTENSEGYSFERKKGARNIDEIDYNKFANNAIIELHGCRSGMELEDFIKDKNLDDRFTRFNNLVDNIAKNMSQELYSAGKEDAVVIAHKTASTPNNEYGYQHLQRVVYHNGKELFNTSKKGNLNRKIKKSLKQQKD